MSASSCPLSDHEMFELMKDINRILWNYTARVKTQLELAKEQSSYRRVMFELNSIRIKIDTVKFNYEQAVRSLQNKISKVLKRRDIFSNILFDSVQDTIGKIPGCLEQIQLDLEKIKQDYADKKIDDDYKDELIKLQAEESRLEELLKNEIPNSKNQEIIFLEEKLHNITRRRMDGYYEEFLQFFQEEKPEIYAKYQLAYQILFSA